MFTDTEKTQLAGEIQVDMAEATKWSVCNKGWDIKFRIGLLLLGLSTVVCSGVAASDLYANPKPWSLISTILAGVSAALSGFAFTDFGFNRRQRIWEKKANLLRSLQGELRYSDPDNENFRKRLERVRELNDQSDPDTEI